MSRIVVCCLLSVSLFACERKVLRVDAGTPDGGMDSTTDAGRQRGDDPDGGWQMVAELPVGAAASTKLGTSVVAIGDQFGQPMVAALFEDPNGDLNYDDNRVVFTRWDGVAKAFTPLKTIEVVGGGVSAPPNRQVSLARDPSTGRIGIAYVKPSNNTIRLATTDDDGVNFSLSTVSDEPRAALMSNPVLAHWGGVTHVGWLQGADVMYRSQTGAGALVDQSPSGVVSTGQSLAMAVDSEGHVAAAFFVVVGGNSADLAFWRPGSSPLTIASADGLDLSSAEKSPSVSLTFVGTSPHLAYHLRKSAEADATELWYLKSSDTGSSWNPAVAIPRNSSSPTEFHSTRWYQAITVDAGKVSIAAPWSGVGTQANCNGPKLARSSDGLTFSTCSPPGSPIQRGGEWINMWTHRAGKQTIVFHYDGRATPGIKAGIVLWKEP